MPEKNKDYDKEALDILKSFVDELNETDIRDGEYPKYASADL